MAAHVAHQLACQGRLCRIQAQRPRLQGIKGSRYLFLSNPENLDERGRERLEKLLELNANINKAYMLKEDLRHMYTLKDEQEAARHLANWAKMAGKSGLKPFVTPAKTLSAQARAVPGYFRHGLTSGVIEGLNSKIAKIRFQVRGISSIRLLYLKLRESTCKEFRERLMPICAQS